MAGESPTQRADARTRRLSLLAIATATVLGALAIVAFERYRPAFEGWLESDPATTVPMALGLLAVLGPVPALALAWYLWGLGRRTVDAGRFPPPGLRLVRDAPLITGESAVRRGRIIQGLSLLLGLAAVGLVLALWRLASVFANASS